MKDQLYLLLDTIGIERQRVSVLDGFLEHEKTTSVMYPNFMQMEDFKNQITDKKLLDQLEAMITEHLLDVQHDLSLIKRHRKNYE